MGARTRKEYCNVFRVKRKVVCNGKEKQLESGLRRVEKVSRYKGKGG